ncbi:MAG: Periplasmic dipeptide transport protein [Oscillospiraceae bacterium]|jgi:peptide/nickel transport system substrate-binding protein
MKMRKKLIALLLSAVLLSVAATGCAGQTGEGQTSSGAPQSSEKSEIDDTIVYGASADPRGLDPALVDDVQSVKIMSNIYEGLLKYKEDSTDIEPCLATSWDVSDDGLTYTFHLRTGVKFHDGTDFNAEAVKYNIERQLPPKVEEDMGYASFVYGSVKEVKVVDENTVQIILKEPCTPFLRNLAMNLGAPIASPTALEENNNNLNEAPCGTGPYQFVKWDKDEAVVLVRNDNYWGDKAKSKNVIFKTIKDNSARVVALSNGEVDIIDDFDYTVVDQITASGNLVKKTPGMNINYMMYNCSRAPFNDPKLRAAVSAAINVPELVTSLYQEYSEPATSILPTFMPGYDESITQVTYDPDTAKQTLEAAGIKNIHMITYSSARQYNAATGKTLAEAIQGYLSKIGITCTIDSYDWTTFKSKEEEGDFDICFAGWIGDNGDPDNFLNLLASQDPGMNVARYNDATYTEMIEKAVKMPDGEERNAIYVQAQKYLAEQAPWLPISHSTILYAVRPNVEGFNLHMTGMTMLANVSKS